MKTFEEAVMACGIMRRADGSGEVTDADHRAGEDLDALQGDIDGCEHMQIYIHGCEDLFFPPDTLPPEVVTLIGMYGRALLVAGVRIGIEMEKQEVAV